MFSDNIAAKYDKQDYNQTLASGRRRTMRSNDLVDAMQGVSVVLPPVAELKQAMRRAGFEDERADQLADLLSRHAGQATSLADLVGILLVSNVGYCHGTLPDKRDRGFGLTPTISTRLGIVVRALVTDETACAKALAVFAAIPTGNRFQ